jgi:hypothetical protein
MSLRPRALPVGFIPPCLPTSAAQPPSGALWLHEIKHDGFRVIARKNGHRVKLYMQAFYWDCPRIEGIPFGYIDRNDWLGAAPAALTPVRWDRYAREMSTVLAAQTLSVWGPRQKAAKGGEAEK